MKPYKPFAYVNRDGDIFLGVKSIYESKTQRYYITYDYQNRATFFYNDSYNISAYSEEELSEDSGYREIFELIQTVFCPDTYRALANLEAGNHATSIEYYRRAKPTSILKLIRLLPYQYAAFTFLEAFMKGDEISIPTLDEERVIDFSSLPFSLRFAYPDPTKTHYPIEVYYFKKMIGEVQFPKDNPQEIFHFIKNIDYRVETKTFRKVLSVCSTYIRKTMKDPEAKSFAYDCLSRFI